MVVVGAEVAEGCIELGRELYHLVRFNDGAVGWRNVPGRDMFGVGLICRP